MKIFRSFAEYLNTKGDIAKPKVDASGDTGPEPVKTPPAAAKSGKGWKNDAALSEKPKAYTPATQPCAAKKGERGFAQDGDKKLIYEPETPKEIGKEGGTKIKSWPKTSEDFLNATKEMSLSEFTHFMGQNSKNGEIFTLRMLSESAKNPHFCRLLVSQLKNDGHLNNFIQEAFRHNEAYNELANSLAYDEDFCHRVVRSLKEMTDAPATETEEGKLPRNPATEKKRKPKSIHGEKLDMGGSDVIASKSQVQPEHYLMQALNRYATKN